MRRNFVDFCVPFYLALWFERVRTPNFREASGVEKIEISGSFSCEKSISFILFSDSTSDTSGSVFDTFEISSAWPDLQAFLGLTLSFSGQVVGD